MNSATKNVVVEKYFYGENYRCPSCDKLVGSSWNKEIKDINFCSKCGQRIIFPKGECNK